MKHLFSMALAICLGCCANAQAQEWQVYAVRHFEKIADVRDPDLTEQGQCRAQALAHWLAQQPLQAIYSTPYVRTQQTAEPSATARQLAVAEYAPRALSDLAAQLKDGRQSALVVGHSNTTAQLVRALGGEAEDLTEADYGDVFIVRFADDKSVTTERLRIGDHCLADV